MISCGEFFLSGCALAVEGAAVRALVARAAS
jgi:hypothetical protein